MRRLRDDDDVDEVVEELEEADPALRLDLAVRPRRSPEPAPEAADERSARDRRPSGGPRARWARLRHVLLYGCHPPSYAASAAPRQPTRSRIVFAIRASTGASATSTPSIATTAGGTSSITGGFRGEQLLDVRGDPAERTLRVGRCVVFTTRDLDWDPAGRVGTRRDEDDDAVEGVLAVADRRRRTDIVDHDPRGTYLSGSASSQAEPSGWPDPGALDAGSDTMCEGDATATSGLGAVTPSIPGDEPHARHRVTDERHQVVAVHRNRQCLRRIRRVPPGVISGPSSRSRFVAYPAIVRHPRPRRSRSPAPTPRDPTSGVVDRVWHRAPGRLSPCVSSTASSSVAMGAPPG